MCSWLSFGGSCGNKIWLLISTNSLIPTKERIHVMASMPRSYTTASKTVGIAMNATIKRLAIAGICICVFFFLVFVFAEQIAVMLNRFIFIFSAISKPKSMRKTRILKLKRTGS